MKSYQFIKVSLILLALTTSTWVASQTEIANTQAYQVDIFNFDHQLIPDSENYQQQWRRLTGFEHSGLHWEQFVVIYTNHGERAYRNNFLEFSAWFDDPEDEDNQPEYFTYPVGTIFIKENYQMLNGKPADPKSITVMVKHPQGYDAEGGNWEYMQFSVNGQQMIKGSRKDKTVKQQCAGCHQNVADRDFIFSNFYSGTN